MQSALGLQVLFIALLLHMMCNPYAKKILDQVETFSLATSILILSCGGLLLHDSTPSGWKIIATVLIFISVTEFMNYACHRKMLAILVYSYFQLAVN